jgi:hypothetical protein
MELEGWKAAEQERFKLYLRDLEADTLNVGRFCSWLR